MSGLIAIIHTDQQPVDKPLLESLTDFLKYRGPDAQNTWFDQHVGLGHAQFITTEEANHEVQPCIIDDAVLISSARLDARQDLIAHLGCIDDIEPATTADSELILRAYHKWGENCLAYLYGDFAFIIWDRRKQQLFCARDRFGMRALYYCKKGNSLIISNSLQCLLKHPQINKDLNDQAIGDFLLFGDHTWLSKVQTAFKDISALPAAHCLLLKIGTTTIRRYWDFPTYICEGKYKNDGEIIESFQQVFTTAVADRLRQKNIVISLSGGLDSGAIAATVCDLIQKLNLPVKLSAVSVVYSRTHNCDEKQYIELVTRELGIPVTYVEGGDYTLLQPAQMYTTRPCDVYTPELYRDSGRAVSELGRVVLTGAAGDNLLSYSPAFGAKPDAGWLKTVLAIIMLRLQYGKRPSLGTGLLARFRQAPEPTENKLFHYYPSFVSPSIEESYNLRDRWRQYHTHKPVSKKERHPAIKHSLIDPDWNMDDAYGDMGFAQAERCDPFLDMRLVEMVLSLPKLPWLFHKHILRKAMKDRLPKAVLQRPKTPLGDLHTSLLQNTGHNPVSHIKLDDRVFQYIHREKFENSWKNNLMSGQQPGGLRPYLLQAWLKSVDSW